ncbi:hypothetical protein [Oceanisphaera pacifica]|uniref:SMP-30/Gluconolactonase/LRE-like region domain-containing protein n=1 Tax=Oceanisphaera pacifica TaxID=2818389 RepID=A0ABS3NIL7_9GAMM|nr:hypothetical protein [Oceanisphaera pacifica]MBO1520434.1 hypothetical protein [Oceanisphaera pacifica]
MTLQEHAARWRVVNGYIGKGGVVIIHQDKVQGWVNELRNPEHWVSGCTAIDERGRTWTAIAGNDNNGALFWLPSHPVEGGTRSPLR